MFYGATEVNVENPSHSDGVTQYERIRLEKLASIHRAVSITVDSKGLNFGVLQSDPKTRWEVVTTFIMMYFNSSVKYCL